MTNKTETTLKDLVDAIDGVSSAVQDSESGMGYDDIYGMTPNSNLGQIASHLAEINKTLKLIAEKINPLHK